LKKPSAAASRLSPFCTRMMKTAGTIAHRLSATRNGSTQSRETDVNTAVVPSTGGANATTTRVDTIKRDDGDVSNEDNCASDDSDEESDHSDDDSDDSEIKKRRKDKPPSSKPARMAAGAPTKTRRVRREQPPKGELRLSISYYVILRDGTFRYIQVQFNRLLWDYLPVSPS
jgi:hypothetical protein